MRMSARISAASRGDREEKGLAPSAELADLAEFADGEFELVSLTLVGVCCANSGQATNKTSGLVKRVTRLIARLLFSAPLNLRLRFLAVRRLLACPKDTKNLVQKPLFLFGVGVGGGRGL